MLENVHITFFEQGVLEQGVVDIGSAKLLAVLYKLFFLMKCVSKLN